MLSDKPQDADKKTADQSICASCGARFDCGARREKCWCFAVEINAETAARLHEKFGDCLCAVCLKKFAAETA